MTTRNDKGAAASATYHRSLGIVCWETRRDRRNLLRFAGLILLWAITYEGISIVHAKADMSAALAWVLAFIPGLPAVAAALAYLKFLREADELIRRVHLTGLAVGFGAGILVWMGMQAPIPVDDPLPHRQLFLAAHFQKALVFAAMVFGWVAGQVLTARRYR